MDDVLVVKVLDRSHQGPHEVSGLLFRVEGLRYDAIEQLAAFKYIRIQFGYKSDTIRIHSDMVGYNRTHSATTHGNTDIPGTWYKECHKKI